jgi:cell division protein FtsZ
MIDELMPFDLPSTEPAIIKVIGVGGGGGNAVTNMFRKGIRDVNYLICNTDKQAMLNSAIPDKLQLGPKTTKGLGAGNHPEIAKAAAEESMEDIKAAFGEHTRMVFVTAGMGGGTGTGAAPVIAGIAREMDILTVGIVTIPFRWEGESKINQALDGVEEMSKNVDALLVINNEQLFRIYPDLTVKNAFLKADDTLTIAAKSIAEIITVPGYINLDFADVNTILKDGGVAVMSAGYGKGQNRLTEALNSALKSPLLNTNADTIAAETAKALAEYFDVHLIYCFEKKGVLMDPEDENSVISEIDANLFKEYVEQGIIREGMIPKLQNAFEAIHCGVKDVTITKAQDILLGKGTRIML